MCATVFAFAQYAAGVPVCPPSVFLGSPPETLAAPSAAVALADFNHDGIPDIAAFSTAQFGESISILIGNGDGTFQTPVVTPLDSLSSTFLTGDFNGDGKADAVIGYFGGGGVVLLGNGDGTFQAGIPFASSSSIAMASGYFDANGTLDLALAGDGLDVLLGNGDGTFGPATHYPTSDTAHSVAVGDFDGDGHADIVVTETNTISVFPGVGNGTLGAPHSTVAGIDLAAVQVADVNGDGKPDVILTSNGLVGVLIGNGDFSFQASQVYGAGPYAVAAVPADLDGDTFPELVVSSVADSYSGMPATIRVLRNQGDGTFVEDGAYASFDRPTAAAVGDLDGDGRVDAVVGSASVNLVVRLMNLGSGKLAAPTVQPDVAGAALTSGDFDENGFLDLVSGGRISFGGPGARFSDGPLQTDWNFSAAAVGDFNGDGHLDVVGVTTPPVGYSLAFAAGNGDGTFQPAVQFPIPGPTAGDVLVRAADFNGDGKLDVVLVDADLFFGSSGQLTLFLGDGKGGFTNTAAMTVDSGIAAGIVVADFNGDGKLDVAAAGNAPLAPGDLDVFLGRGDGTFDLPVVHPLAAPTFAMTGGVFTQSGITDLVIGLGTATFLLPGNGDGTFGSAQAVAPIAARALSAADFNGDGKLDLLVSDYQSVAYLPGLGGGAFGAPVVYPDSDASGPIVTGDFDANGSLDVVMSTPSGVVLLRNARLAAELPGLDVAVASAEHWLVRASGFGAVSYQWRKGGTPLSDGGTISGAHTATLTIDPVSFADAGSYDVVVTDSCTSVASNTATLSVEFADVPLSSIFHDDIIKVATAGITAGCGGADYCPTNPVRRDQMAVFLLKAEHGSSYVPPACTGVFADVPCPGPFTDWVERLAAEGITAGCGGGDYCPSNPVRRAQMAVFLLKTKLGSSYSPPPAMGIFGDVPIGSFAADFIEDLYNRGITGGCSSSPLLYCPGSSVSRAQMAALLVKTFLTP